MLSPLFWNSYSVLWIFCIYFHVLALSLIFNLYTIFSEFWNNSNFSFNSLTWHFAGSKLAAYGIHCVLISVVGFFISKLRFLISDGSFFNKCQWIPMLQYPTKTLRCELQIRNVLSFVCLFLAAKQLLQGGLYSGFANWSLVLGTAGCSCVFGEFSVSSLFILCGSCDVLQKRFYWNISGRNEKIQIHHSYCFQD